MKREDGEYDPTLGRRYEDEDEDVDVPGDMKSGACWDVCPGQGAARNLDDVRINGVIVRHPMAIYRGRRYQGCNWAKPLLADGREGEWKQKKTVKEIWGPFFEHYKAMEIKSISYEDDYLDGQVYTISADEVLDDWDPFWTRASYDNPYKITMGRKNK